MFLGRYKKLYDSNKDHVNDAYYENDGGGIFCTFLVHKL